MKRQRKPSEHLEKATTPGQIYINKERCKGCGYCVEFCPKDVLKMSTEFSPKGYILAAVDDEAKCIACGYCEVLCPEFAVTLSVPVKSSDD